MHQPTARIIAVLVLALLAGGCVAPAPPGNQARNGRTGQVSARTNQCGLITCRLWRKTLYQAAKDPHLRLTQAPQTRDVLVEYDEQQGKSTRLELRAYSLFAYATNTSKHPKPGFVNPAACAAMEPIPLLDATASDNPPSNGYCAVLAADRHSFVLWHNGADLGCFDLPVYREARPTVWRIALTPVCVTADAAIIGAVIGVAGLSAGMGP